MTCDRAWAEADFVQKQGPSCYKLGTACPSSFGPGLCCHALGTKSHLPSCRTQPSAPGLVHSPPSLVQEMPGSQILYLERKRFMHACMVTTNVFRNWEHQ